MSKTLVTFFLFLLFSPCLAQTRPAVLDYSIPADALRFEKDAREPKEKIVTYYLPGAEPSYATMIAVEKRLKKGDVLLSRKLYKNKAENANKSFRHDILHGVWREWYPNEQLKSEAPYFEGVRDGVFRHWDEEGQLIGQYQITQGEGVIKIYNSQGILIEEEHLIADPTQRALIMHFYAPLKQRELRWMKGKYPDGPSYSFYSDGSMRGIAFYLSLPDAGDRIFHGPYIRFGKQGVATEVEWSVMSKKVSAQEYAAAAAKDPKLPPYFADVNQYKTFVTPEAKALLKHYRELPPVKIPLEFDAKGEPLPASPPIDKPLPEKETPQ